MNVEYFLATAAAGLAAAQQSDLPEPIRKLRPMLDGVVPIGEEERAARREKARRLMAENKLDAIYLESGSSMYYFTGQRTRRAGRNSRREGQVRRRCGRRRTPRRAAQALRGMGVATGKIGMEEQVRFATFDGLRRELPAVECVAERRWWRAAG